MKDGDNTPPTDWMSRRQWSHDLLSLCLETKKTTPRIQTVLRASPFGGERVRKEIKPRLPSSGRFCVPPPSVLQVQEQGVAPCSSQSPAPTPHQIAPALVKVKKEPGTFQSLKRMHTKVIELDSPSPQPRRRNALLLHMLPLQLPMASLKSESRMTLASLGLERVMSEWQP